MALGAWKHGDLFVYFAVEVFRVGLNKKVLLK
jgi:hypothetical protein